MTSQIEVKHVLSPGEAETIVSSWVTAKIMASPEASGAEKMSAVSLYFNPGDGHARHNHPASEQLIFVIGGEGEMMIEDEAGQPITTAIRSRQPRHHSARRLPFHLQYRLGAIAILAVYSPAGPEAAMRNSDEFTVLAPGVVPTRT